MAKSQHTGALRLDQSSNVFRIRRGVRVRPDGAEQSTVRMRRAMIEKSKPALAKAALVGEDPALTLMHLAMVKVGEEGLPAFNLRLIVRDDRPPEIRLGEAARRADLKYAEMLLAEARARIAWMDGGSESDRKALRNAHHAALAAYKEAITTYLAVPSTKRFEIDRKRRRVGKRWLGVHPEWQALIDEDEARLPKQARKRA